MEEEEDWKKNGVEKKNVSPSVSVFSVPAPFQGMVGAAQERAIGSWLRLSPHIRVVLIGKHPSLMSFALRMASSSDRRVFVESDVDFTYRSFTFSYLGVHFCLILLTYYIFFCFIALLICPLSGVGNPQHFSPL